MSRRDVLGWFAAQGAGIVVPESLLLQRNEIIP
jgi:hypothetical protein